MGCEVSHHRQVLADELAPGDSIFRASAGDSESHLHYQRRRIAEHVAAGSYQGSQLIPE